jgi:predicted RNase H-like HicB family nuclease
MRYPVFLKQRDGEYWAVVPLLPSCTAQGRTREEVLHNVRMAIEEALADMEITTVEINIPMRQATSSGWRPIRSRLCLHRDRGRATAQRVHGQEVFSLYLDYLGDDDRITTAALDDRTHPCCPWFDAVTSLRGRREGVETLGRARIVSGSQLCHNRPPRGRL